MITFLLTRLEVCSPKRSVSRILSLARQRWTQINQEENVTVRVYQNSAVVISGVTLKGQYSGQPISGEYRSILVWVKGVGGWQLVSNQLTALKPK